MFTKLLESNDKLKKVLKNEKIDQIKKFVTQKGL